jgi:hypothetical protein
LGSFAPNNRCRVAIRALQKGSGSLGWAAERHWNTSSPQVNLGFLMYFFDLSGHLDKKW